MGKLTNKYPAEFKSRRKNSTLKVKYTQDNERLLEEFLTAREELKCQFEKEKCELISNYERRNKYLRTLLEEYSEKIDMLKLNLDAEKEENKILKEKLGVMDDDNSVNTTLLRDSNNTKPLHFLQHRYKSNTLDSKNSDKMSDFLTPPPMSETSDIDCRSDVSSLRKNSDSKSDVSTLSKHYSSSTTISKYSDTYSLRAHNATPTPCIPPTTYIGIHATCREEFSRLLEEIRVQKLKYEEQLSAQKRSMRTEFERERLQIEQCVFKQLNNKLEKEFKRRELLMNERDCLHHCLSNTIVEATLNYNSNQRNNQNSKKLIPYDTTWAETNSDSGADVGDNRSDDDGDNVPRDDDGIPRNDGGIPREERPEKSTNTCNNFINDILCNTVIGDILREQKKRLTCEFQRQIETEKKHWKTMTSSLNANIANLVNENDWLKKQVVSSGNFFDDLSSFQSDIKQKLASLKYLLDEDPYAC